MTLCRGPALLQPGQQRWQPGGAARGNELAAAPTGVEQVVKVLVVAEDHVAAHVKKEALGGDICACQAACLRLLQPDQAGGQGWARQLGARARKAAVERGAPPCSWHWSRNIGLWILPINIYIPLLMPGSNTAGSAEAAACEACPPPAAVLPQPASLLGAESCSLLPIRKQHLLGGAGARDVHQHTTDWALQGLHHVGACLVHQQPAGVPKLMQTRGRAQTSGSGAHNEHADLRARKGGVGEPRLPSKKVPLP